MVVQVIVAGQQLDGEAHGGATFAVPAHIMQLAVFILDKLDVAAAAVQQDKVIFGNEFFGAAGQNR